MSFFALLVALLLDLALRQFEHLRGPRWFHAYFESLAFLAQAANFWRAGFGMLVIVLVPAVVTLFVGHLLDQIWAGLGFAFAVLILLLTLGPQDLHAQATEYIKAVRAGNSERVEGLARALLRAKPPAEPAACSEAITHVVFSEANERLFGILFWFALLGPAGAVLYRSTDFLRRLPPAEQRSGEFIQAVARLHGVLAWIPAHLAALGYGLAGSFEDAVSEVKTFYANCTLRFYQVNEDLLACAGLGALHAGGEEAGTERLRAALVLVRRTLILWMAVYALIALVGWTW
ncbi:MAG: regulatory signaling modulator protein AmpE [Gammaproteobacteria bacterium]|nr:regulatory signaling modulator protein AmpE [Gammaproteobacteria bacterium]MBU6509053.1 regulatory signaling modulator protein AmpE [Gammaproteobacteria bacterium]MDE1983531.1 regulatory signaling modulator protein AmpE [Gammaproteobacteria bacterium]MDE2107960.1 regulatory signaling modulator protein AmpE [Gammaproteobacteria bacterium]MDE2460016.1 regulatory signaling modulator protein AmpE [Gammaproteobacteria bacterium]